MQETEVLQKVKQKLEDLSKLSGVEAGVAQDEIHNIQQLIATLASERLQSARQQQPEVSAGSTTESAITPLLLLQ